MIDTSNLVPAGTQDQPVWVSGGSYVVGQQVISPAAFRVYVRKTIGGGTTDPSLDSTNWVDSVSPFIGDFAESPDIGALVTAASGQQWLRTGSVATGASYPLAQAVDYLKCTGAASTQATSLSATNTDIATDGANRWVIAYGDATNLLYSTDNGATWATVAHNATQIVTSVCWNATNSLFVCAGNTTTNFFTSTQTAASVGSAWTVRTGSAITGGTATTALVRASAAEVVMTCGGGTTGNASRSTNGTTWTAANFIAAPYTAINQASLVSLGSSIWLVQGSGPSQTQRSTDGGTTWATAVGIGSTVSQGAFGAGICVIPEVGSPGNIYTSATGATGTWTNRGNPFGMWRALQIMFDGTRFIASLSVLLGSSGFKNAYAYSTDGLTWSIRGFLNKSWADTIQTRIHSDGTNLVFAPIFTSSSGAVFGTFASTTNIGIPYVCSSSSVSTNAQLATLQYVRIK